MELAAAPIGGRSEGSGAIPPASAAPGSGSAGVAAPDSGGGGRASAVAIIDSDDIAKKMNHKYLKVCVSRAPAVLSL